MQTKGFKTRLIFHFSKKGVLVKGLKCPSVLVSGKCVGVHCLAALQHGWVWTRNLSTATPSLANQCSTLLAHITFICDSFRRFRGETKCNLMVIHYRSHQCQNVSVQSENCSLSFQPLNTTSSRKRQVRSCLCFGAFEWRENCLRVTFQNVPSHPSNIWSFFCVCVCVCVCVRPNLKTGKALRGFLITAGVFHIADLFLQGFPSTHRRKRAWG